MVVTFVGTIFLPKQFFFPALMSYVLYGIGRTVIAGLMDRLPSPRDDEFDDADDEDDRRRQRRRRRQLARQTPARPVTSEDPPA